MASCFVAADEEFIEELRNTCENKNSKRSTDYWTNIFQQWAKTRGKNEQLECCEEPELNEALNNQVIASALGQLRINSACIFKVFQISLVASRLGQLMSAIIVHFYLTFSNNNIWIDSENYCCMADLLVVLLLDTFLH